MSDSAKRELLERAAAYDRSWIDDRPQDLRGFLHPDVVFSGNGFRRVTAGVDASLQSYVDFMTVTRVHDFTASDYVVDIVGPAAIMTYRWTIDYEHAGQRCLETGHDLLVWVRHADRWVIAWRNQARDPSR